MEEKIKQLKNVKEKASKHAKNTSTFFKGLFPVQDYIEESEEIVDDCFFRHDVPQGDHIPADLKDVKGDLLVNSTGHPVVSIISLEDATIGGQSPARPLMLGFWTGSVGLGHILMALGMPLLGAAIPVIYLAMLWTMFSVWELVIFGFFTGFGSIITYLPHLLPFGSGMALYGSTGFMRIAGIASYLAPALIPYVFYRRENRRYAHVLAETARHFNGALVSSIRSTQNDARLTQAANVITDKTYAVALGEAIGALTAHGDSLAPDAGLEARTSIKDMSRSIIWFGRPGTGKTTLLRVLLRGFWLEEAWIARTKNLHFDSLSERDKEEIRKEVMNEWDSQLDSMNGRRDQEKRDISDLDRIKTEVIKELIAERKLQTNRQELTKRELLDIEYKYDAMLEEEYKLLNKETV